MVQEASIRGIPKSILNEFPEVWGTANAVPLEEYNEGTPKFEVRGVKTGRSQSATPNKAVTRKPITEVQEVLDEGLRLF